MKARELAASYNIPWQTSVSRPWDLHGPYCHPQRDVLNLLPDGSITACFKASTGSVAADWIIGTIDSSDRRVCFDAARIAKINALHREIPIICQDCFNQYHCARGCPDNCPGQTDQETLVNSFRCRLSWMLSDQLIRLEADRAIRNSRADGIIVVKMEQN